MGAKKHAPHTSTDQGMKKMNSGNEPICPERPDGGRGYESHRLTFRFQIRKVNSTGIGCYNNVRTTATDDIEGNIRFIT